MFDIITQDSGLIEITIVLLILVSIAIWQKLYQAALVMGGVYIIYILYITISPKDAPTIPSTNLDSSVEQEIIIPQIIDDSTNLIPNIDDVGKVDTLSESVDSDEVMIQTIDSTIEFTKIYEPEIDNIESIISVLSMTVGTGIINRRIENPDSLFSVDTKRIYCLTGIHNQNDSKVIYHKWYQEGRLRSKVKLELERSNLWRTWSYITIKGQKTGNWQIVVEDTSGIRYDSLSFQIVDSVKE
jgi:ABC-type cobalt transport system substrate-binding protein